MEIAVAAPTAIIGVLMAIAPPPLPVLVDVLLVDVEEPVCFDVPVDVVLVPLPPLRVDIFS